MLETIGYSPKTSAENGTGKSGLNIVDLYDTSDGELEAFSKLVSLRSGKVQIMVHPYFVDLLEEERYKILRDQFVRSCIENQVPLIIFEEKTSVNALRTRLETQRHTGTVYLVKTEKSDDKIADQRGIRALMEILKSAGVNHVSVGGMYMCLNLIHGPSRRHFQKDGLTTTNWYDNGIHPTGCAGAVATNLKKEGIKVSINTPSYPDYIQGSQIVRAPWRWD